MEGELYLEIVSVIHGGPKCSAPIGQKWLSFQQQFKIGRRRQKEKWWRDVGGLKWVIMETWVPRCYQKKVKHRRRRAEIQLSFIMTASRISLSVLLAFLLATVAVNALGVQPVVNRVRGIRNRIGSRGVSSLCSKTSFPDLCISTAGILQRRRGTGAAALAKASILATMDATNQAKALAGRFLAGNKGVNANLNVCREMYDDALSNLNLSLKNLNERSLSDLKINLSAVLTDYTTCDDAFEEEPGMSSPLAKINSQLNKLTKNNLALASSLG